MPSNIAKGKVMNKDQVKGTVKEAAGKVQQKAGKLLGSPEQEAKGLTKKLQGKAQKKVGDAKEALADARARRGCACTSAPPGSLCGAARLRDNEPVVNCAEYSPRQQ